MTDRQDLVSVYAPHPPYRLATITVLNPASYLRLLGIYNSARLVSANTNLRKSIQLKYR
ncbi:MAG TPA: hypothetical protein VIP70_05665 [Nitrososphaeraceae archaeon]